MSCDTLMRSHQFVERMHSARNNICINNGHFVCVRILFISDRRRRRRHRRPLPQQQRRPSSEEEKNRISISVCAECLSAHIWRGWPMIVHIVNIGVSPNGSGYLREFSILLISNSGWDEQGIYTNKTSQYCDSMAMNRASTLIRIEEIFWQTLNFDWARETPTIVNVKVH